MEPRFILWRKVRFPLAAAIVLFILIVSGFLLRTFLVARGIRQELEQAAELAANDTFESHRAGLELLDELSAEYPGDASILTQLAWQRVLVILRFGGADAEIAAARQAVEAASGGTPLLRAARGGIALAEGNAQAAIDAVGSDADHRECVFVRALAQYRLGQVTAALSGLDEARQGTPPYVPALGELAALLREQRRYNEAERALKVITSASPEHEGAAVHGALLALDKNSGNAAALAKLAGPLSKRLGAVSVDEKRPRLLAYKNFAAGRLALLNGDPAGAAKALAGAATVLNKNQAVANYLALARRNGGHFEEALEALAEFPNTSETDTALLETRLAILLALHRTNDAEAPLTVLANNKSNDVALVKGQLFLARGEPAKAEPFLRQALAKHPEVAVDLADILMGAGQAGKARDVLRGVKAEGSAKTCATAYLFYLNGKTRRARSLLHDAAKAGGRCGPVLAGRMLIESGAAEEQAPQLVKSLAQREDLRDRVLLARFKLRIEGGAAARAELDKVRSLHPQGAVVLRELALGYRELGLFDEAAAVATEGAKIAKNHPLVVAVAVQLAREGRENAAALKQVNEAVKSHPGSVQLLLEQATLQVRLSRFPDAAAAASKATVPGPLYPAAICLHAQILARRGEREEAQVSLARALTAARRQSGVVAEAEVRQCLVAFHLKRGPSAMGRTKTAMFYLRRMPVQAAGIENVAGQVAERDNRSSDAESRYRAALKLDPAHRASWRRLAKMRRLTKEDRQQFERLWPGQNPEGR